MFAKANLLEKTIMKIDGNIRKWFDSEQNLIETGDLENMTFEQIIEAIENIAPHLLAPFSDIRVSQEKECLRLLATACKKIPDFSQKRHSTPREVLVLLRLRYFHADDGLDHLYKSNTLYERIIQSIDQ